MKFNVQYETMFTSYDFGICNKRYNKVSHRNISNRHKGAAMTTQAIEKTVYAAFEHFNSKMKSAYTSDNVKLAFYDNSDADAQYKRFCGEYFHDRLADNNELRNAYASAFTGKDYDGIMIRRDFSGSQSELFTIVLHELSHIWCTHNEIPTGDFYDRYCKGNMENTLLDGTINAGYAIWREFAAIYLSTNIQGVEYYPSLSEIEQTVLEVAELIRPDNPAAKISMTDFLACVLMSKEGNNKNVWESVNVWFSQIGLTHFISIANLVYVHIRSERFWEIDGDFIETLGSLYFAVLAQNRK